MTYPATNVHFTVDWGGTNIGFSDVSGLGMEHEVIEYRNGASPQFSTIKLPGLTRFENVTLTRGLTQGDNEFFEWFNQQRPNKAERRDIIIQLLNEAHEPIVVWRVKNAFPVRLDYSPLTSEEGNVMMESLEIAHEGMRVEHV